MQNTTRIALGLGAAAVVASTGSAFTASNTGMVNGEMLGYNSATVSGVAVSNIKYTPASDPSLLSSVEFTATGTTVSTGHSAVLSLNGTASTGAACSFLVSGSNTLITCPAGNVAISGLNAVALTVAVQ